MITQSAISALCRSFNSASFGGDGGRLCVMGGGCNDAAELGRGRESCFYSCLGCCQFEKGAWKQHGQLETTTFRGARANPPAQGGIAAELGCGRRSCFYSCLSCCQ